VPPSATIIPNAVGRTRPVAPDTFSEPFMPIGLRAAAALSLTALACAVTLFTRPSSVAGEETKPADAKVGFSKDIPPLLIEKCGRCHGDMKPKKGIAYVTSYETTMKTVRVDKPDDSRLYEALLGKGAKLMPPKKPLTDDEIAKVRAWIAAGAKNN
jgi:cytochrome c553